MRRIGDIGERLLFTPGPATPGTEGGGRTVQDGDEGQDGGR